MKAATGPGGAGVRWSEISSGYRTIGAPETKALLRDDRTAKPLSWQTEQAMLSPDSLPILGIPRGYRSRRLSVAVWMSRRSVVPSEIEGEQYTESDRMSRGIAILGSTGSIGRNAAGDRRAGPDYAVAGSAAAPSQHRSSRRAGSVSPSPCRCSMMTTPGGLPRCWMDGTPGFWWGLRVWSKWRSRIAWTPF